MSFREARWSASSCRVASAMRGSTEAMTSRAWVYALLVRALRSAMDLSLVRGTGGYQSHPLVGRDVTCVAGPAVGGPHRLVLWTRVSHHGIHSCGTPVRGLRLLDMVTAATHAHLVVRRHVDFGRTRSMMCWPR